MRYAIGVAPPAATGSRASTRHVSQASELPAGRRTSTEWLPHLPTSSGHDTRGAGRRSM